MGVPAFIIFRFIRLFAETGLFAIFSLKRGGAGDLHLFPGFRVSKAECGGMKHQAVGKPFGLLIVIKLATENRVANFSAVYA